MNYMSTVLLAVVLIVGGCAAGEVQQSRANVAPWTKVAAARTRADHENLAAWYLQEAAAASERAAAHRKLRDGYASSPRLYDGSGMVGHCTNLISQYEEAAGENTALAELHRRLAGEAKE